VRHGRKRSQPVDTHGLTPVGNYLLGRTSSARARGLGITVLLIPLMTSAVVRLYGWMILLATSGPINKLLLALHLVDRPLQLLFKPQGVVIALAEVLLPFMVLAVMPVIQGIDVHLEEGSQNLGQDLWRRFVAEFSPCRCPGSLQVRFWSSC
jgi:putative spermidine/putrescine transport system permease protein